MRSKLLAVVLISGAAVAATPLQAHAVGYTPQGPSVEVSASGSGLLSFSGFQPNERTTASAPNAVALAALHAVTSMTRTTDDAGRVEYAATATIPGSYTITVTSQSGTVSVGTLTVLPADAATGSTTAQPERGAPLVWAGVAGVLVIATLAVVLVLRRRRLRTQQSN